MKSNNEILSGLILYLFIFVGCVSAFGFFNAVAVMAFVNSITNSVRISKE